MSCFDRRLIGGGLESGATAHRQFSDELQTPAG
jgi:hypothetical protein